VSTRKPKLSPNALLAVAVLVPLVAGALGWFVLVAPKRSKVAGLDAEIALVEQQIAERRVRLSQTHAGATEELASADLFRLAKAMPDSPDMAGVLLELNQIAADSGITFESIAPQTAPAGADYQSLPVQVTFDGTFYNLSDFLLRLRRLVRVRDGRLDARGRLFTVDALSFAESEQGFPRLQATLTIKAFVFGTTPVGAAPAPQAEEAPAPAPADAPPAGEITAAGAQ
jgi:Tfp pilus assembly protein PilO